MKSGTQAFRAYLEGLGLAPRSVAQYLRWQASWGQQDPAAWFASYVDSDTPKGTATPCLAAARHYLRMQGRAEDAAALQLPRGTEQRDYREALTRGELDTFIRELRASTVPQPSKSLLELLPHCGLRIEEACTLRLDAYTERDGMPGYTIRGKRGKKRWVPFNSDAIAVVDNRDIRPSDYLFPSPKRGKEPAKANTVQHHLRAFRETLPASLQGITAHVLRHTFATLVLEAATEQGIEGETLIMLRDILGHSNIETTLIYAKPSARMLSNAVKLLEQKP